MFVLWQNNLFRRVSLEVRFSYKVNFNMNNLSFTGIYALQDEPILAGLALEKIKKGKPYGLEYCKIRTDESDIVIIGTKEDAQIFRKKKKFTNFLSSISKIVKNNPGNYIPGLINSIFGANAQYSIIDNEMLKKFAERKIAINFDDGAITEYSEEIVTKNGIVLPQITRAVYSDKKSAYFTVRKVFSPLPDKSELRRTNSRKDEKSRLEYFIFEDGTRVDYHYRGDSKELLFAMFSNGVIETEQGEVDLKKKTITFANCFNDEQVFNFDGELLMYRYNNGLELHYKDDEVAKMVCPDGNAIRYKV